MLTSLLEAESVTFPGSRTNTDSAVCWWCPAKGPSPPDSGPALGDVLELCPDCASLSSEYFSALTLLGIRRPGLLCQNGVNLCRSPCQPNCPVVSLLVWDLWAADSHILSLSPSPLRLGLVHPHAPLASPLGFPWGISSENASSAYLPRPSCTPAWALPLVMTDQ